MKKQQGFTLIELMIVVAIIGVLSAVAIPAYKNYVSKSELASAMATLKSIRTPAELQIQETGTLDTDISKLGMSAGSNTLGTITATAGTSTAGSTLEFEFNNTSSIENSKITLERTANGWTCTQDSGITIKGCS